MEIAAERLRHMLNEWAEEERIYIMALVKCPECGRENVSDSAEMCPDCGYSIKKHFDMIKEQQLKQEIYEEKLQNVRMPEEPKRMKFAYGLTIFFGFGALCGFITSPVAGIIMILFACWTFYMGSKQYNEEMEKYNLAITNFEKYQQEIVKEEERNERIEALKPKCPSCGSTNIQKITTTDRALSVAMVGVASGKIGKQYKCKNCKHMW